MANVVAHFVCLSPQMHRQNLTSNEPWSNSLPTLSAETPNWGGGISGAHYHSTNPSPVLARFLLVGAINSPDLESELVILVCFYR